MLAGSQRSGNSPEYEASRPADAPDLCVGRLVGAQSFLRVTAIFAALNAPT